jgi:hypothetical protein
MVVRKTRAGWILEITNTIHGCLEQGGVLGREVLITREGLEKCNIDYGWDPDESVGDLQTPVWAIALEFVRSEFSGPYIKVLRRGRRIN